MSTASINETAPASPPARSNSTQRLVSLDALRGFDMFWIVGAEEIVHALHKVSQSGPLDFLKEQFTHKPWQGVTFYDLIFPLFVFIVGVSLVFSLTKTLEQSGRAVAYRRILLRSLSLYLIGIIYYGGLAKTINDIRLLGVLQRIALCYFFAGLLFCSFKVRGLVVACVVLLVGYWAMMTFIPVPGIGAGHFNEGANLANYLDTEYLPFRKWDGDHDPEGLLSTLPAIATCLLGVFAGLLLKNQTLAGPKKVQGLIGAGVAGLLLGFLWGLQFPIIKKIWTSSYVLVAGGYSCLFLALFYQVIELWKFQKWAQPFVWIGMNPIAVYLAWAFFPFADLANRLAGGPVKASLGNAGEVLITMLALGMVFLLSRFLSRRKIFLRL
jgi:predicted acyltransferase